MTFLFLIFLFFIVGSSTLPLAIRLLPALHMLSSSSASPMHGDWQQQQQANQEPCKEKGGVKAPSHSIAARLPRPSHHLSFLRFALPPEFPCLPPGFRPRSHFE